MRKLIYSMGISLDGFIAGPGGEIDWSAPDEELHRFHNEQARATGAYVYGRRLYEEMKVWDVADQRPDAPAAVVEFAGIWKATPKIVFSRSLDRVEGTNMRLATGDAAAEVARLKAQDGGELSVGGAGLAATFVEPGLVDEYRLFVNPVIVGGGTPFFPPLEDRIGLDLVETRTFGSRVVYLRYRVREGG
jgi:dihydrofolate reductase